MTTATLSIMRLPHAQDIPLPSRGSAEAAGLDLRAAMESPITIAPGERALIPTGLVFGMDPGYEVQVRPRSGLALKHGVTVLNSPGTIDSDYRGEIGVILINHGSEPFVVFRGDRVAQAVMARLTPFEVMLVDSISLTQRGAGGFGSSGKD